MADLKKWFPFRFKRNEPKAEAKANEPPVVPDSVFPALMGSPFPHMDQIMRRMLSDRFFQEPLSMFGNMERFFGDFTPTRFAPSIDVTDEGETVKVTAELPGMDRDDVELEVHEGVMLLKGHKKHEETKDEEGCYRTERFYGSFSRRIPLPRDLAFDKAEASFDKGVLTVTLPKVERQFQARTIEVK